MSTTGGRSASAEKKGLRGRGGELIGVSQNYIRYDLFLLPYGKEPI